jgi:iron complex transport system substrate-binding protein
MKPSQRRRIVIAASALCLSLLLAACSEHADSPAAQAAAVTHELTDAADRKLRVPQSPQRVVALSEIDLDSLLALDLAPAGATDGRGSDHPPAYLGERTQGIASVGNFAQPSIDRILMLQPDLILAGGHPDPQLLEQLNAIAPTAVSFKVGEPWQASFERIATFVGRRDRADAFLARHRERVLGLRARLREHEGESVSIVRLSPNGPMAMLGDAFAGRVLADLGFVRPPAQRAAGAGHAPPLSREVLADIDGDWLFIGNFTPDPQSVAALRSEPAFASLAAARAGHVREVDAMLWTVIGGPIAAEAVLDDVERTLLPAATAAKTAD